MVEIRCYALMMVMVLVCATGQTIPSVFADVDGDETGFSEPIIGIFDWINELVSENIETSDMSNETKTNLQNTLDAGTDAGATGTKLWFGIHAFFVDGIYALTTEAGLEVDRDIISIVSIIIVFVALFSILRHLWKENMKIFIIVIAILLILGISGIVIEF